VAGDVDDVVGPRHHEEVAVLVDVAGVGGLVVPGERRQVDLSVTLLCVPERRR
jgi:hypothetical protein